MEFNPFKRKISELSKIEPKKGRFLVSEPFMDDPYFKRSVVFLTEHNDEGTVGFILNQPLDIKLSDILVDFPDFDANVFLGGPVQPQNLFYLHRKGELIPESVKVNEDIYWNGNFESLKAMIQQGEIDPLEIKFFLGYSGWDRDQLRDELSGDSWFVQESNSEIILDSSEADLWKKVMQQAENDIALMANFPENPNLN
ncbi:MAG: YqgE/AlgH family protein [Vicingaceae bacterium]